MYEFLKLIVQPVVLERNESGAVVNEQVGQPTPLYSRDAVLAFFETVEQQIAEENAKNKEVPADGS